MSLFDAARPNPAGFKDLSPAELPVPLPEGVRLIDVREPHEFVGELGHVPGATLVPLATVPAQAVSWDRSAEYVMVCRSGGRSGQAAQALVKAGFGKVMNLVGGMLAWNQAGLKTEK
ncbi:MAG: rhodanese-like domain-containing protein [Myxococcaceae bacterium]|nr:rhodanese-like domain-containing protein [Myxococcaceae bacterium]